MHGQIWVKLLPCLNSKYHNRNIYIFSLMHGIPCTQPRCSFKHDHLATAEHIRHQQSNNHISIRCQMKGTEQGRSTRGNNRAVHNKNERQAQVLIKLAAMTHAALHGATKCWSNCHLGSDRISSTVFFFGRAVGTFLLNKWHR